VIGHRCKYCTEGIGFVRTAGGDRMPVDLITCRPDDDENTIFDPKVHRSHFANCPGATKARKPRKKKRAQEKLPWGRPDPN
jgi:hypothetical protein